MIQMDEFEKDYFEKLKKLARGYTNKRQELAKSRIKMFAAALTRQLIDEGEKFDLILSAGNSGLFMDKITEMVYERLGIQTPQRIILPIFRFKDDSGKIALFDNSVLGKMLEEKLKNLPENSSVLFIDDEIMQGITVKAALELILSERPDIKHLEALIIAEHHFFEWHYKIPKVSVIFFAYSRLIQRLNGNIGYLVPPDLYSKILPFIPEAISYNHAMAIVIGGGLKRIGKDGIPYFDNKAEEICMQKIPGFKQIKDSLLNDIKVLVAEGINEYKKGEIKFRF